eukprot:gnl/MRDRNA2_/MRDRNA2_69541_c0_seq2.p1 gnl/MRDRNA2_/MRDRNA2_69541_c0~~gnl/MRDRNA2_/MRDRNA2_69541_c0_seq2.p1  ORF type:complete len:213 (-),score=37.38 gnl/MRDRNA2_/MRDRNA2_69541_c0_seq2:3-641(-)
MAFASKRGLNYHKRTQHSEDGNRHFPCNFPYCRNKKERAFTRNYFLLRHMESQHSKDGGRSFACDVLGCDRSGDKAFTRKSSLKDHQRRMHSHDEGRHLPCDVPECPRVGSKAFKKMYDLRTHMKRKHPEEAGNLSSRAKTPSTSADEKAQDRSRANKQQIEMEGAAATLEQCHSDCSLNFSIAASAARAFAAQMEAESTAQRIVLELDPGI